MATMARLATTSPVPAQTSHPGHVVYQGSFPVCSLLLDEFEFEGAALVAVVVMGTVPLGVTVVLDPLVGESMLVDVGGTAVLCGVAVVVAALVVVPGTVVVPFASAVRLLGTAVVPFSSAVMLIGVTLVESGGTVVCDAVVGATCVVPVVGFTVEVVVLDTGPSPGSTDVVLDPWVNPRVVGTSVGPQGSTTLVAVVPIGDPGVSAGSAVGCATVPFGACVLPTVVLGPIEGPGTSVVPTVVGATLLVPFVGFGAIVVLSVISVGN
jgi:hypothetical protein